MGYLIYNILLLLASPVILCVLLAKKRCRRGLTQRFGWIPHEFQISGISCDLDSCGLFGRGGHHRPFCEGPERSGIPIGPFSFQPLPKPVEKPLNSGWLTSRFIVIYHLTFLGWLRPTFGNFVQWLSCLLKRNSGRIS